MMHGQKNIELNVRRSSKYFRHYSPTLSS